PRRAYIAQKHRFPDAKRQRIPRGLRCLLFVPILLSRSRYLFLYDREDIIAILRQRNYAAAAFLQLYLSSVYFAAGFLNNPSITAPIMEPTSNATIYISAFPTTGNTKIPPCGAISVQPKAMD